jgi:NAD(P) transhydrogenase subunit beta
MERGLVGLPGLLPFVGIAAAVGALLGRALPVSPVPARLAWIPGLAAGAAALSAAGFWLSATRGTSVDRITAAVVALAAGGAALALGLGLAGARKETARGNALAALVVALAGLATTALGYALANLALLVVGGIAGTAGIALGRIVGAASDRSFSSLLFGGGAAAAGEYAHVRSCGAEEAAMIIENAGRIVIIPGFGMAAAQAQHPLKEMTELLARKGAQVTWAIHPDAGCVPGHMNIVLDEANVPHEVVTELSRAAAEIATADAVVVVGANDVVNPAGAQDPASPVYGLPVPDLTRARSVFVIKRSLRPGAAGVKNALFEQPNTTMVFGDAKKVAQALVAELKSGAVH